MKLIDEKKRQYKVEMHCHTACSDGDFSPEELKAQYQKNGFDAVAFTDHDIFLRHNELTDENFVALNGYELNVPTAKHRALRSFHINFIAQDPGIAVMPGFDPVYVFQPNAKAYLNQVQAAEPSGFRDFSPEGLNRLIKAGNDNGFLVSMNHPGWSMCTDADTLPLEGLFAIEVHNSGTANYRPMDEMIYQNMLLSGKKLNCLATNDFHSFKNDNMAAAVYVQAEKLTYEALIKALKQGRFYSSTGPRITKLEIVEDVLHLECSRAKTVVIETATENPKHIVAEDVGFTRGSFPLGMAEKEWFRVTVTDQQGRKAWTNAVHNYPLLQLQEVFPDGCESLLICGREESLCAQDVGVRGKTCFQEEFIPGQIRELMAVTETMRSKQVTAVFSTTESLHFDLYYYGGKELQEAKQQKKLAELDQALTELEQWLGETGVSLRIAAMRPLPHNPQMRDYRNGHIRDVNAKLLAFCQKNSMEYMDAYSPMAQENGILRPELEGVDDRKVFYRELLKH